MWCHCKSALPEDVPPTQSDYRIISPTRITSLLVRLICSGACVTQSSFGHNLPWRELSLERIFSSFICGMRSNTELVKECFIWRVASLCFLVLSYIESRFYLLKYFLLVLLLNTFRYISLPLSLLAHVFDLVNIETVTVSFIKSVLSTHQSGSIYCDLHSNVGKLCEWEWAMYLPARDVVKHLKKASKMSQSPTFDLSVI